MIRFPCRLSDTGAGRREADMIRRLASERNQQNQEKDQKKEQETDQENEQKRAEAGAETQDEQVTRDRIRGILLRELQYQLMKGADDGQKADPQAEDHEETLETNARRLVASIIDHGIAKGECRGLKYLTDLVGIGEQAEIRRRQMTLQEDRAALQRETAKSRESGNQEGQSVDTSRAVLVFESIRHAMENTLPPRTMESVLGFDL